jgi:2'-5' RNA ligase
MTQDYRIFIGAFPGGDIGERIKQVRQAIDPKTARITAPHVTIVGTYLRNGPATPENEQDTIDKLQALQEQIAPFELALGGVRTFPGEHPVIYLGVEVTPGLLAARAALLSALGGDKHSEFVPHITLAMRLGGSVARQALEDLQATGWLMQSFSAPITELQLVQRGPQDPAWRCISALKLK